MIGKALFISSVIYALYAVSKSKYAMSEAFLRSGSHFGMGIEQARRKNRRGKIIRRRRSH